MIKICKIDWHNCDARSRGYKGTTPAGIEYLVAMSNGRWKVYGIQSTTKPMYVDELDVGKKMCVDDFNDRIKKCLT